MPEKQYFTGIDIINAPRIEGLTVTEDGTYTASSDVIGYNPVVVNTNQPWQPLQDGYSNFWFELTEDTLSPWLNFSAKTENAVIDWGDGSGEVALDTLTPTHTYSKAGRYVVKVKGVTSIGVMNNNTISTLCPIVYVELAEEVTNSGKWYECSLLKEFSMANSSPTFNYAPFIYCYSLEKIHLNSFPANVVGQFFEYCCNLVYVDLTGAVTLNANTFYNCRYLTNINLPSTITTITGGNNFKNCIRLREIHCLSTTPPSLDSVNVFAGMPSDFIIYVPVGYAETYKAASGWSTYADHILEEGQTPNRAMLAKFNSAKTDEPQDDMR